jgi:tetratricopeptide (TPR) repeat protein
MKTPEQLVYTVKPNQILDNALQTLHRGDFAEALHLFNMVLLLDADNKVAQTKRALCYMYMGKLKTAKAMLAKILDQGENDAEAYFHLAELYKINMDYEVALTFLVKALEINNDQTAYLQVAAELCYLQKDVNEAYHFINKAIVQSPFRKDLYYWRALILVKFEKPAIALGDLNKALSFDEHYADAYRLRAHCKMLLGDVESYLNDLRIAQHVDQYNHKQRLAA